MFCTELKLNAKVCPSNAVIQTRGKTPSLPAFQIMVQYNGNPSKEGSTPLSWRGLSCHPVPAPYSVQESVIFLLRNQITFLLASNVFKVFFPATSLLCHRHALLLLHCPDHGCRQNPASHFDLPQEQPTLYYEITGTKLANFSPPSLF